MEVGFVYDPIYLRHDTGQHVENAKRLEAIISHLEQTGLKQQLSLIKPRAATTEELLLVHDQQYILHIKDVAQKGGGWLDADTVMSADSYEAALYAAGGVIGATEAVMDREWIPFLLWSDRRGTMPPMSKLWAFACLIMWLLLLNVL